MAGPYVAMEDLFGALADRNLRTPTLRTALARSVAGQGNTIIYCPEDSKGMARGAGTTGSGQAGIVGARPYCKSYTMAKTIGARYGLEVNTEAVLGLHGCSIAEYPTYDSRVTIGADIVAGNVFSAAGDMIRFNTNTTGKYNLTPTIQFDKFDIICYGSLNASTLNVSIDGGSTVLGTIDCNKANPGQMFRTTFTVTKGNYTISVYWASGSQAAFMQSIMPYDSTKSVIQVLMGGSSGSTSTNWAQSSAVYHPSNQGISVLGAHGVLYCIGTNDKTAGTAIAVTEPNIQTVATKVLATGSDLILCCPSPRQADSAQILQDYSDMYKRLGLANNCLVIDESALYKSWSDANSRGLFFDPTHENKIGYAYLGQARADFLS